MTAIKYPKGYPQRKGYTKIAVSFPDPVFKAILTRAKLEKKEFNAMVVELCKVGELDLSESDRYEPAAQGEQPWAM